MKKTALLLGLLFSLTVFPQDIKITYSMIDELYPNENLSMVVKVSDGGISIKEIYLVASAMQGNEEKRFKMNYADKTASVSALFSMLPKTDFYYYFEVIRKDNEIFYFPLLPSDRIKNKVTHRKEPAFSPTKPMLLSPLTESNLTPENFLFAVYVEGKSGPLKLVVDGEDVTDKCIVGEKILTYNPGRIFQPRKYRFDIIQDEVLLQTYYFNFASEGFVRSLLRGALTCDFSYDKAYKDNYIGDLKLDLFGKVSSFYYRTGILLGNSFANSPYNIEKYYALLGVNRQRLEIGTIDISKDNFLVAESDAIGAEVNANIYSFGFKVLYGYLNTSFLPKQDSYTKEAFSASLNFNSRYFFSETGAYRFCDSGESLLQYNPSDDIILYHKESLRAWGERFIIDYSGGFVSTKDALYGKGFNVFESADSSFRDSFAKTYSQNVKTSVMLEYFSMSAEFEDISSDFKALHLAGESSGKKNMYLSADIPLFSERLFIGSNGVLSFIKTDSGEIFGPMSKRNLDFFVLFKEKYFPAVSLSYIDRVWLNSFSDTIDFNQRLYGFKSNASGIFYIGNLKTESFLLVEQLNYKTTPDDSDNYSVGGFAFEAKAHLTENVKLFIGANSHRTMKLEYSIRDDIYKSGMEIEKMFGFITPSLNSSFHIRSDSTASELKRINISASILIVFSEFKWQTSFEENLNFQDNSPLSGFTSLRSFIRYDF